MKKQRFVKKVEWEKRPVIGETFTSSLFLGFFIFMLMFLAFPPWGSDAADLNNGEIVGLTIIFLVCAVSMICLLFDSLGKGRKVYWEKI